MRHHHPFDTCADGRAEAHDLGGAHGRVRRELAWHQPGTNYVLRDAAVDLGFAVGETASDVGEKARGPQIAPAGTNGAQEVEFRADGRRLIDRIDREARNWGNAGHGDVAIVTDGLQVGLKAYDGVRRHLIHVAELAAAKEAATPAQARAEGRRLGAGGALRIVGTKTRNL